MSLAMKGVRHAGGLYRTMFRKALRPWLRIEVEARHLHEIEQVGYAGETPFIAILGLWIFLGSAFAFLLLVASLAYYLS